MVSSLRPFHISLCLVILAINNVPAKHYPPLTNVLYMQLAWSLQLTFLFSSSWKSTAMFWLRALPCFLIVSTLTFQTREKWFYLAPKFNQFKHWVVTFLWLLLSITIKHKFEIYSYLNTTLGRKVSSFDSMLWILACKYTF